MSVVSRFMANPGKEHWTIVKWVFRYLKGSIDKVLVYGGAKELKEPNIIGYTNADYASDLDKRRSSTGYVFQLWNSTISWKTNLQPVVALSTTGSEYIAMTEAVKESLWLKGLVSELLGNNVKAILKCDSQSAIHLAKNQNHHERTKHIDIRYHFIREILEKKEINLIKVAGNDNAANMFTKAVHMSKLHHCLRLL